MIPPRIKEGLDAYASHHVQPGGFLRAVLENDLVAATGRADLNSAEALVEIVTYAVNRLPRACWGSPRAVKEWLAAESAIGSEEEPDDGPVTPLVVDVNEAFDRR